MTKHSGTRPAAWREGWNEGEDSKFTGRDLPEGPSEYATLTYEVDGRVARLTFNRPDAGNAITADTPRDIAAAVERADLDPRVHVIVLSGRGKGFCGGYDLAASAEHLLDGEGTGVTGGGPRAGVGPPGQMGHHPPPQKWGPLGGYARMSRASPGLR